MRSFRVADRTEGIPVELHPAWFASLVSATFVTTAGLLDVVVRPDGVGHYDALDPDAVTFDLDGLAVRVASLDHIIASKTAADRPKDRAALPLLRALRQQLRRPRAS